MSANAAEAARVQPDLFAFERRKMLTQERLKELLHYDPETGIFTWRANAGGRGNRLEGVQAGCLHHKGYIDIGLDGKYYRAHRLAWLYVHGVWPADKIDHKDQDKTNNRIGNLRLATHKQNGENRGLLSNNTSGFKGVCWRKDSAKWHAQISHVGKKIHIGDFDTPEEASAAYEKMAGILFTHYKKAA